MGHCAECRWPVSSQHQHQRQDQRLEPQQRRGHAPDTRVRNKRQLRSICRLGTRSLQSPIPHRTPLLQPLLTYPLTVPQRHIHSLRPRKRLHLRLQQRNRAPRTLPLRSRPPSSRRVLLSRIETTSSRRRRTHHRSLRRNIWGASRKLHWPRRVGVEFGLE